MRVTKEFKAEIAHRLLGHPGLCQNVHGHSYRFQVTIGGPVNPSTGMVVDFKDLKEVMEKTIGYWDHALLLQDGDPLAASLSEANIRIVTTPKRPTAEWMAGEIARRLQASSGLNVISVKVWETATSFAEWVRSI